MSWWERQFWTLAKATKLVQEYTPTVAGEGSLVLSSVVINVARYWRIPFLKLCWLRVAATFTTADSGAGTGITTVTCSLPLTGGPIYQTMASFVVPAGTALAGIVLIDSTTAARIRRYDSAAWGIGASRGFRIQGLYEIA